MTNKEREVFEKFWNEHCDSLEQLTKSEAEDLFELGLTIGKCKEGGLI